MNDAALRQAREMYQVFMDGAHGGDEFIQSGFDHRINKVAADIEGYATQFGVDADALRAAVVDARSAGRPTNAAKRLENFFRSHV